MAIVQISKIQHRTGEDALLPQLDVGEIGYSTDLQRLYIGDDPQLHPPQGLIAVTEILTANSPISLSQITGSQKSKLSLTNLINGQIIVASVDANSVVTLVNAGGAGNGNISDIPNTEINLGTNAHVKLAGGNARQVLQSDGYGGLLWVNFETIGSTTANGLPGGVQGDIQINNGGGNFDGDSRFNIRGNTLSVGYPATGPLHIKATGNITAPNLFGNLNGTVGGITPNSGAFTSITANTTVQVGGNLFAGNIQSNGIATIAGNLTSGNIQSNGMANIGNLRVNGLIQSNLVPMSDSAYDLGSSASAWKDLYLSGTTIYLGTETIEANSAGITIANSLFAGNVNVSGNITSTTLHGLITTAAQPNITSLGNLVNLAVTGPANLGNVANLTIAGGTSGEVLTSDGSGAVLWKAPLQALTKPSGNTTEIQINEAGSFGSSPSLTFDHTSSLMSVSKLAVTTSANLGDLGNIRILGGTNGQYLRTNGSGALTWGSGAGGGGVVAGGSSTQVQYNTAGMFAGSVNFTFTASTNTLSVTNITGTLTTAAQPNITSVGNLTSLTVTGNFKAGNANLGNAVVANYFVGSGANLTNLNGANIGIVANATYAANASFADVAGNAATITTNAQPNITSVGNLTGLIVHGVTSLGNVGNLIITGGANGQFLTTNGSGNLTWSSSLAAGGANTQIQFNDGATFAGSANLVFNTTTNTLTVPNIAATLTTAAQNNITSVGNLTSLSVTGRIYASNANISNTVTANFFSGNADALFGIPGANVTGIVANATYAANAATVLATSLPNVTTIGTLGNLTITSNLSAGNANLGDIVVANYFYGEGSNISNIWANHIIGNVPNANFASYSSLVTGASQANIHTLGVLTGATIYSGNIGGNLTSFDIDRFAVLGHNSLMAVSTDASGFTIQTGQNQTGAGLYGLNGVGAGLLAPNTANALLSDIIVLAKGDAVSNALALVPTGDLNTNLGAKSDDVVGKARFKNLYVGDINMEAPSAVAKWSLMAGTDGLYMYNSVNSKTYKISMTEITGVTYKPTPLGV